MSSPLGVEAEILLQTVYFLRMVPVDAAPRRTMLLLAAVALVAILPGLGRVSLFEPDEPRFA